METGSAHSRQGWKPAFRQKGAGALQKVALRISGGHASSPLLSSALIVLGSVFTSSSATFLVLGVHLSTGIISIVTAATMLLCIFLLVLRRLDEHGHKKFGYANTVTAVRAAIACFAGSELVLGALVQPDGDVPPLLITLIVAALALDGVDGWLARKFQQQSALGARFDMEVDAFLILILAAAALLLGKAGAWVLLTGLMRYIFVLGQWLMPSLDAPLPESFRRQAICVFQVSSLCIILLPVIMPPVSTAIAATALVLLIYSFASDTVYLMQNRKVSR